MYVGNFCLSSSIVILFCRGFVVILLVFLDDDLILKSHVIESPNSFTWLNFIELTWVVQWQNGLGDLSVRFFKIKIKVKLNFNY